ncbi:MAG: NAD(P)H-nitrite reductase [Candidatus Uhrbacteria bacterium GW2011_GWD2_52_7]|uniref:NAD(P)H-nitrite reductase n=1 Tax=Candidatus Uhrbacteria bacterium GW2011_GWD2_52_7 TaxID=1618989 RepID=A0A0G1XF27_9BACT|nr:MAG: NAD(P)H-nitrite reductase [Candidatus Uhrbacteria bacterium GW2011_GWD2_52_7]
MLATRVEEISVTNSFVRTSEGRELPFDQLLLATGGELNLADEDMRGVVYLRGVDDVDQIDALARELRMKPQEDRNVVVYGGGFIAFEFINYFAHLKANTTVLMRGRGFWSSVLSDESQALLRKTAEAHGVHVVTGVKSISLKGDKQLEHVVADTETLPADILGVGIGIHPERELFTDAGIEVRSGIVTNEYLETAHPGVFAAGDGAEFYDRFAGRHVTYGNWMNAQMQGRAVAHIMHGERKPFELVSSYSTHLFDLQMVFIGDIDRQAADNVVLARADEGATEELFYRQGKLVGGILIGDIARRMAITAEIRG